MIDFPITSLISLPGSFGNISLGETFVSSVNVSNESLGGGGGGGGVKGARLRVEIQATNTKVVLEDLKPSKQRREGSEVGGGEREREVEEGGWLKSGEAMGTVVKWEIKELGMHMLVCEVYWLEGEGVAEVERSFRKVYK